jgi:hypothetical protein
VSCLCAAWWQCVCGCAGGLGVWTRLTCACACAAVGWDAAGVDGQTWRRCRLCVCVQCAVERVTKGRHRLVPQNDRHGAPPPARGMPMPRLTAHRVPYDGRRGRRAMPLEAFSAIRAVPRLAATSVSSGDAAAVTPRSRWAHRIAARIEFMLWARRRSSFRRRPAAVSQPARRRPGSTQRWLRLYDPAATLQRGGPCIWESVL